MTAAEQSDGKSVAIPGQRMNRLLIALLILQVGLFAITRAVSSTPPSMAPKKLLADLDVKTVSRIKIVDGEGKVVELARKGGKWVLASGGDYPTRDDKVSEALGKLAAVTATEPVADNRTHHRALEVADDKFERKITLTRDGGKPIELLLGSSAALKRVHFRFAGKQEVYSAGELTTWDLGTSATSWVDGEYFKVEKKEIVALGLRNGEGELSLTRGGSAEDWVLAGLGAGEQIKKTEVDSLLSSASSMTLQEPVGETVQPAFELDKPQAELTLVIEKEAPKPDDAAKKDDAAKTGDAAQKDDAAASQPAKVRQTFTVKIGAKKDDAYYAKASTSKYVVLVGSWAAETLTKKKLADLKEPLKKDGDKDDAAAPARPALPPGMGMPGMGLPPMGGGHP